VIQSIERHDIVNAAALAGALLLCGILLLRWIGYLGETVGDGLWQADKAESAEDAVNDIDIASVYINGSRPPNEVGVRVANGSEGRNGLAGRGTERLSSFGYGTLTPENKVGDPTATSTTPKGLCSTPGRWPPCSRYRRRTSSNSAPKTSV
jgi:hypothetical protein